MNVTERFLKYVLFDTTSCDESTSFPSTDGQLMLADFLVEQLKEIGVVDAARDENGYVWGHIPATPGCEDQPKIGLIAHMDTSPDVSGKNVKTKIIKFDGNNINMLDSKYIGSDMIVTDNTTLLGADDKAGIAEIISACERVISDDLEHGKICISFTPDEEIGAGADRFDFERFDADFAYTVDGGEIGEIEYENFNAAAADIDFSGINTHPGSAKNKMRNASLYLAEFISLLPASETPATTEHREGFYHVTDIRGDVSHAHLSMLIREFDSELYQKRKQFIRDAVEFINKKYGDGTAKLTMTDSYRNMKEIIDSNMHIVDRAKRAMKNSGLEPVILPIRGGTDGARLSFEGLPCPNLSTGGINFHSIYETIPVDALLKMSDVIVNIVTDMGGK